MRTILTTHILICILLLPGFVKAQTIIISGKVTSSNGEALENVSIFESNKNIGTITNEKGYFKLILSAGEIKINITESGFVDFSQEIHITKDSIFAVKLTPVIQNKNRNRKQTNLEAAVKVEKSFKNHRFR